MPRAAPGLPISTSRVVATLQQPRVAVHHPADQHPQGDPLVQGRDMAEGGVGLQHRLQAELEVSSGSSGP